MTNNSELKNMSCKCMYKLLSSHPHHPRIESTRPHLNFSKIWSTFQTKFVDPFSKDISWRIVHEILPVQQLLCKYNMSKVFKCNLCNSTLESNSHLFYSCPQVQPLLELVFELISGVACIRTFPSEPMILYHILPDNCKMNISNRNVILYLLMDYKFVISSCRNLKKFENRNINSNFIIMLMLNRLKFRITADFKRLPLPIFYDYWIAPSVFCDLDNDDNSKLDLYF